LIDEIRSIGDQSAIDNIAFLDIDGGQHFPFRN
jgi:hypothetical protein